MSPKWHLAYFVPIDGYFGQIDIHSDGYSLRKLIAWPAPRVRLHRGSSGAAPGNFLEFKRTNYPEKQSGRRFNHIFTDSYNKIGQMPLWQHGHYLAITW